MLRLHLANNLAACGEHQSLVLSSAIYGSMRFKASRDTMRRLAAAELAPEGVNKFLDDVFAQVGHIESLRDKIAHQVIVPSVSPGEGFWQVSDQTVTRDLKKLKIYLFDTAAVEAAAADLTTAGSRLGNQTVGTRFFANEGFDLTPIAWRYKSSMLKHVLRGTGRILQGRVPPLRPSDG